MIVYREFSSLSNDLGFSGKALYGVSYNIDKHYHQIKIPKADGEIRELCVPDAFLKAIQSKIAGMLLPLEQISPYATAYRSGGSTKVNASVHIGKPIVVKLDIRHFFDHIIYPLVKEKVFTTEKYSEPNRILLSLLCTYKNVLPQGAPTSPAISNIIMRDFDNEVGAWCKERSVNYTRYCDDMTFSGDFNSNQLIPFVSSELKKLGFYLNSKKTRIIRQGQRQMITGIVVNERLAVPADYKRKIRQEIYYCGKYGVASHILKECPNQSVLLYLSGLLGRINYVLSVEPNNGEMKEYKAAVVEWKNVFGSLKNDIYTAL